MVHPIAASDLVARARSACGHEASYALGAGGYNEKREWPWVETFVSRKRQPDGTTRDVLLNRACDCTGFVSWLIRAHRHLDAATMPGWIASWGAWLETTQLVRDANAPWGYVARVPWIKARPGSIFVYGDDPQRGSGHVGLVVEHDGTAPSRVIHCSAGNYRSRGDAIGETTPAVFFKHGITAEFAPWLVDYDH